MPRKKRFRRSSAQLGFEPMLAPDGFTEASKWREFGCEVDIVAIFNKYSNPDKAYIYSFSKDEPQLPPLAYSLIYRTVGETVNGIDYVYNNYRVAFVWTPGSTKRWAIVNSAALITQEGLPRGAQWAYFYKSATAGSVGNPYLRGVFANSKLTITNTNKNSDFQGCSALSGCNLYTNNIQSIGALAFYTLGIKNVYMGTVLYSIGTIAFIGCTALKIVEFNVNLNSLGNQAFQGCTGLINIQIPSLVTMGAGVFQNCSSISILSLPSNLTTIGSQSFDNCISLTNTTIPPSITTLGFRAFYSCTALTAFQVPPNLVATTGLGGGVISNTIIPVANVTSLSSIYTVGNIGTVGYGCIFEEVGGVKKRAISAPKTFAGLGGSLDLASYVSGLTNIDAYAFYKCTSITSLTIPSGLTTIGASAFENCTNIASDLVLPATCTSIGSNAFYANKITRIEILGGTAIADTAFYGCNRATVLILPPNLVSIGSQSFYSVAASNLTLPNSLTTIAYGGLQGMFNLLEIIIPSNVSSIGNNAFQASSSLLTITMNTTKLTTFGAVTAHPFSSCTNVETLNLINGYKDTLNIWNFSQKLALTTATADALYTSMMNIANGAAGNIKIIHIGAINKTNLILNATNGATVVADLAAGYKQLNASNTTLSVATTGVAITSITVASTAGYLASGSIMLGTTSITYTSITATTFVFASRVIPAYSIETVVSEI